MPKTAVGLFMDREIVDDAMREIEALGFPRNELRTLGEPLDLGRSGMLGIPRIDFEVDLFRELTRMGASRAAAELYVDGVRRGGVLVFATGSEEKVDQAAGIMNRYGAVETEEENALEPHLHTVLQERGATRSAGEVQVGRLRQPEGGAKLFFW